MNLHDLQLKNLGTVNKNVVTLGPLTVWFSYTTPVAFRFGSRYLVRVNDWSVTTGKFLNELEADKSKRIDGDIFESELAGILNRLNLA